MESIIINKEIIFSGSRRIINERLIKLEKRDSTIRSLDISKKEEERLKDSLTKYTDELSKIRNFNRKYNNVYIKMNIGKEFTTFENYRSDIRTMRKMNVSLKSDNIKFSNEFFGEDIGYFLNNFEEIYKQFISKCSKKCAFYESDLKKIPFIKFKQEATAYLFHELVGHLLEEDAYNIEGNYLKNTNINIPEWLIVIHENGKYPDSLNIGELDDNGDIYENRTLIEKGKISGIIGKGNYRASSIFYHPIPRMRTITVKTVKNNPEQNFSDCLIINKILAGLVNPINGIVNILCDDVSVEIDNEVFKVNGKLLICGELKTLLENLVFLASNNNFKTGKCIKQGQIINIGVDGPDSVFLNKGLYLCKK